jgi:hypothetical protein
MWNGPTGRGPTVHPGPRWTAVTQTEGAAVPRRRAACGSWSSPVLIVDGGGGRVGRGGAREVLTGARAVAKRRRTGGSEQRQLELVARAKEGTKELGREGMRCGEGWVLIALL